MSYITSKTCLSISKLQYNLLVASYSPVFLVYKPIKQLKYEGYFGKTKFNITCIFLKTLGQFHKIAKYNHCNFRSTRHVIAHERNTRAEVRDANTRVRKKK